MTFEKGGERTFVDTSVLVYAHHQSDLKRQAIAQELVEDLWVRRAGVVSTQVLCEFYVVTRNLDPPIERVEAREIIDAYCAWPVVQVDPPLILAATALEARHSFSFWDALIVESAIRSGSTRIASEDLQDGRRISGVQIRNPFK